MRNTALENYNYADSYLGTAESMFRAEERRFDNDLLYNMISISFEKFMVGWIALHDTMATSHLPLMLYRELKSLDPTADDSIKRIAILIGSFEGICSLEDFGYRTPTDAQVEEMIEGLHKVRKEFSGHLFT